MKIDQARLSAGARIVDVLVELGFAASKSAARSLVEQGAISVGDRKISDVNAVVQADDHGKRVNVGKKRKGRLQFI